MKKNEPLKENTRMTMESDGLKKPKEDMRPVQKSNVVTNGCYVTTSQTHAKNVIKIMAWTVVDWHREVNGEKKQEKHIAT